MLDLLKLYWRSTTFRRRMQCPLEEARLGLAKVYPRMQRTGNHGIFGKRRVPRGRAAGGTGGGCRLLGNIGNQDVCQLPPTVSGSTFSLDGTALRTYTARPTQVKKVSPL
jgi:hypothetical protein